MLPPEAVAAQPHAAPAGLNEHLGAGKSSDMAVPSLANPVPAGLGTVLVTRPQPQADAWVARLTAAGWPAQALPLMHIAPAPDPQALSQVHLGLRAGDLVMFVSPNAARCYWHAVAPPPQPLAWPDGVGAAATGPGTVAVLRQAGVPAEAIVAPADDAPQFDSEALWAQLRAQPWAGRRVWVVRGDGGRDWLSQQLMQAGAQVQSLCSYRRLPPEDSPAHRLILAQALRRPAEHVWLLSSSECVANLCEWAPGADWSASWALATHPRIGQSAQAAGFGHVLATRPDLSSVLATLRPIGASTPPSTIWVTP